MKKKIFSITVVMILLLLGTTTVSDARMNRNVQKTTLEKQSILNRPIELGSATVEGDGIEGNTIVDAVAVRNATIKIGSGQETVDLKITYSIECDGTEDLGIVLLFAQLNGLGVGDDIVITTDTSNGEIIIPNVVIANNNILTYQITALYYNSNPRFNKIDLDTFGSLVRKPRIKGFENKFYCYPLIQLLLNLPNFVKLLA